MAQTRRTAGVRSRAARGRERQESQREQAVHGADHAARARGDTAYEHTEHSHERAHERTRAHDSSPSAAEPPASFVDVEQLQEAATEMAPQLGAAAVAALATAVILPEFLPAVLIGAGATLAPKLLPGMGYMFRPVMKTVMRAGYAAFSTVQHFAAEAGEQMQDVIAEVQSEQSSRGGSHRRHAGGHEGAETGAAAH